MHCGPSLLSVIPWLRTRPTGPGFGDSFTNVTKLGNLHDRSRATRLISELPKETHASAFLQFEIE